MFRAPIDVILGIQLSHPNNFIFNAYKRGLIKEPLLTVNIKDRMTFGARDNQKCFE